ncbi:uridylate kinase [uncultured archaeon]|nr:uridylate kinase [uncultured archaeon]
MKPIVISLGGSIISKETLELEFIQKFSRMLKNTEKFDKFGIVVGGGRLARTYISSLKEYNINDNVLDEIGINATRMNALTVSTFLEGVNSKIPTTVNDASELVAVYRHVVMGGTEPGHTTDTVATLLAERIGARTLINATSVDGVYSDDPKKVKNARKFDHLSYDEAIKLAVDKSIGAGPNVFMDITALNIAKRSKLKVCVIDGTNMEEYEKVMEGKSISGTVIE